MKPVKPWTLLNKSILLVIVNNFYIKHILRLECSKIYKLHAWIVFNLLLNTAGKHLKHYQYPRFFGISLWFSLSNLANCLTSFYRQHCLCFPSENNQVGSNLAIEVVTLPDPCFLCNFQIILHLNFLELVKYKGTGVYWQWMNQCT